MNYLLSIGVTVSHKAANTKLQNAQDLATDTVKKWHTALETVATSTALEEVATSSEEHINTDGQPIIPPAHNIQEVHCESLSLDVPDHDYFSRPRTTIQQPSSNTAPGFRLNIDNLDYELSVRNMTMSHQNKSHHYVQVSML